MLALLELRKKEENVNSELESKKKEFAEKMESCALKKVQLKKKSDEVCVININI